VAEFVPSVSHDTVAVVGGPDEANPLFIYGQPFPALLDDSTVVYSDLRSPGGRIAVVNLFTGDGWEIESRQGAEGPGEFGGQTPLVFPWGNVIHTLTVSGGHNRFDRSGDLLATNRYGQGWMTGGALVQIGGIAGGLAVVHTREWPSRREGEQSTRQAIGLYDFDGATVAEIVEGIPTIVSRMVPQRGNAVRHQTVSGEGLFVHARGETIVWGMTLDRTLNLSDARGRLLASRRFDVPILDAFVDADGRIWARVRARAESGALGNIVLDRELNELFRVAANGVRDASGNAILVRAFGELDIIRLVLLEVRAK
jgi:hypothetical protein